MKCRSSTGINFFVTTRGKCLTMILSTTTTVNANVCVSEIALSMEDLSEDTSQPYQEDTIIPFCP
jgi:hypothetical protein